MNQFFASLFYHSTPQACVSDLTPPTFAGISTLVPQLNGSLRATWLAATDATTPIRYRIYIQKDTATGLFSSSNMALETETLTKDIFQLKDGSLLLEDVTYYVGVRAVDAVGNESSNLGSLSGLSSGVLTGSLLTIAQDILTATQNLTSGGTSLVAELIETVMSVEIIEEA